MNSYEKLVAEIQEEAKNFQEENRQLRENLAAIIEENNRLRSNRNGINDDVDLIGNFRRSYIDMAEKIFRNLREQFVLCQKVCENDILHKFLHMTIYRKRKCLKLYIIEQQKRLKEKFL